MTKIAIGLYPAGHEAYEFPKIPTLKELDKDIGDDCDCVMSYLKLNVIIHYLSKPKKPYLNKEHNSKEAEDYTNALKEYEKEVDLWNKSCESIREHNSKVYLLMEDWVKENSGLYTKVPEKYQSKVYYKAYEDGHANGYTEVYIQLLSLIEIFE